MVFSSPGSFTTEQALRNRLYYSTRWVTLSRARTRDARREDTSPQSSGGGISCDVPQAFRLFIYVRRENTYSTTVVSWIRWRITECTLSCVRFNAEQLGTSLLGPGSHEHCAGKLVSPGNVRLTTQGRKNVRDDYTNTRYRHAC